MVDHITEIPLPGRSFATASDAARRVALPSFIAGPENRLVATAIGALLEDGLSDGVLLNAEVSSSAALHPSALERRRRSIPPADKHAEFDDSAEDRSDPRKAVRMLAATLVLYGPSGTGKTHLARGAVCYWQQQRGVDSAEYLTASDFRRQLVAAIDEKQTDLFRRRLRARQFIALDDIHSLPPDDYLLEELRNTLDDLLLAGSKVLVTAARPVATLRNLTPDLQSRLAAGLSLQLAPPGPAARARLVRQASIALGSPLAESDADRLAAGVPGTANDLFGAVCELCLAGARQRLDEGGDTAETYLAHRAARQPELREIIAVVAKYHRLPQKVLKSSSRRQSAVYARATVVFLARELAGASYEQIGRALGGRDHTTIMHNYRKMLRELRRDPATQEALEQLRRILLSR